MQIIMEYGSHFRLMPFQLKGLGNGDSSLLRQAIDGKIDNVILFDRTNDPHEMNNIASQQLKLTHTFNRQLKTWLEKTNDPFAQYIKLK